MTAGCDALIETAGTEMAPTATARQENRRNILLTDFAGWTKAEDEVVEDYQDKNQVTNSAFTERETYCVRHLRLWWILNVGGCSVEMLGLLNLRI